MEFRVKRSNELYHFGIPGMKWGVRRYQNPDGSLTQDGRERYLNARKIGKEIYLAETKKSKLSNWLSKYSKSIAKESKKTRDYHVLKDGQKIGDLELYSESKDGTNIVWISIDKKERGKKYAQTVMDYVIKQEKKNGKKYLTLEVPGDSPDARHIYEKKGFVPGETITDEDDVWGGLTVMRLELD